MDIDEVPNFVFNDNDFSDQNTIFKDVLGCFIMHTSKTKFNVFHRGKTLLIEFPKTPI